MANKQDDAKMLFDSFWHEGELCILFADTNVGKSVLAVQIGDSISRGEPIDNFKMTAVKTSVLYFDFELTTKQFEVRYKGDNYGNYYFDAKFCRAVLNPDATSARKFGSYAEYINNALENTIITTKAKILIIDNITCLHTGTESASSALKLMQNLQRIKNKYKLSILVLAHTPKRNPARPISRNDLQGSKMLINFCDSAFAIGESQSVPGTQYIKQIKQRSSAEAYGEDKICLCRIIKPFHFLYFEFTGYGHETDHLLHYTEQQRKKAEARVAQLHTQGKSLRQIAGEINLSHTTIARIIKRLERQ
jgi:hypothetical protein